MTQLWKHPQDPSVDAVKYIKKASKTFSQSGPQGAWRRR